MPVLEDWKLFVFRALAARPKSHTCNQNRKEDAGKNTIDRSRCGGQNRLGSVVGVSSSNERSTPVSTYLGNLGAIPGVEEQHIHALQVAVHDGHRAVGVQRLHPLRHVLQHLKALLPGDL